MERRSETIELVSKLSAAPYPADSQERLTWASAPGCDGPCSVMAAARRAKPWSGLPALPSLSNEFRLAGGVDFCSELFSSLAIREALPPREPGPDGAPPSRLDRPRSWFFLDLNKKAIVGLRAGVPPGAPLRKRRQPRRLPGEVTRSRCNLRAGDSMWSMRLMTEGAGGAGISGN